MEYHNKPLVITPSELKFLFNSIILVNKKFMILFIGSLTLSTFSQTIYSLSDAHNIVQIGYKWLMAENLKNEESDNINSMIDYRFTFGIITTIALIVIIILLLYNILKRRKYEMHLLESEQKFKDIVEFLPQIVFEVDFIGNIIFVNKQGKEMFGYTNNEKIENINFYNLFLPGELPHIRSYIHALLNGKKPTDNIYSAVKKNGTVFSLQVYSNLVYSKDKPVGIRGICIDMTAQKQIESELIFARERAEQSDKLKSAFLSNISHEIRTPLNSIIGFANLLAMNNLSDEYKEELNSYIQNSSDYLLNLVNDIFDYSKIETGQLEIRNSEFNLSEMMEGLYNRFSEKLIRDKQDIELIYNNLNDLNRIVIYNDQVRLKQILVNLLNNAFRFTEKGQVIFGFEFQTDNQLLFYVKDTGIGIAEKDKSFVFQKFNKILHNDDKIYPGAGLGLTICNSLIQLLGGSIWFESEIGKGSSFYIKFPVKQLVN